MGNDDDLTVVPVKHRLRAWGYAIVNPEGKVVARGHRTGFGRPGFRTKSGALAEGERELKAMRRNAKRVDKALRKRGF